MEYAYILKRKEKSVYEINGGTIMSNSELLKAFNRAYSLGNTIPQGQDRAVLEKLTRQFAETNKISYTEDELEEVIDFAMKNLPMNERANHTFPDEITLSLLNVTIYLNPEHQTMLPGSVRLKDCYSPYFVFLRARVAWGRSRSCAAFRVVPSFCRA